MKRVIFTVTTGRSGTMFLSELMKLVPGVHSLHELHPGFHEVMRRAQSNQEVASSFLLQYRIPYINTIEEPIYFEANHVFCEGFYVPLLTLGIVPDLVLLMRDPREVALSRWRRRDIPGRTFTGKQWLLSPWDKTVLVKLEDPDKYTDYQLCYWHTQEIATRQDAYAERQKKTGGLAVFVALEQLSRYISFCLFLEKMGFDKVDESEYNKVRNTKWNTNKDRSSMPDNIDEQEREILREIYGQS